MNRDFRKLSLQHIAKKAGLITDMVTQTFGLDNGSFKDKFLKFSPGLAREEFIYNEITKRKPPINLIPIQVNAPDGSKITYSVMPDYITIEGIRVPMAGVTAQKVANFYGMNLPTSKMSKQIWEAADTKIRPTPLSAGGTIDGKYYTGRQVVDKKISDSDSSVAYSQMIEDELKKHPGANLIAGHMKDIIAPEGDPNKLGLFGWFDAKGKPLQYSAQTPHSTTVHAEYGSGTRLVGNQVTIIKPDGTKYNTTLENVLNDPTLSKAIATVPGAKKYKF